MLIAVFGGAGKAGTAVVQEALARGHEVRALVRTPARFTIRHAQLEVVEGRFEDTPALDRTLAGADAVITSIGVTSRQRPTLLVDSVSAIRGGMRRAGVERLVVVQGVHMAFPSDPGNPGLRVLRLLIGATMRPLALDGRALGALLSQDPGGWTVVRMPRLVEGRATGRAIAGRLRVSPLSTVVSGDVAAFALQCVEHGQHLRAMPMIASAHTAPAGAAEPVDAAGTAATSAARLRLP